MSGKYLVQAFWNWTNSFYDTDSSPYDALGLWMSKQSNSTPASGQAFDSSGCAVYDSNGSQITGNMWTSDFDSANAGVTWALLTYIIHPLIIMLVLRGRDGFG